MSDPTYGPLALRERIRAYAGDLGFEQVGFAPAEPPAHLDAYRAWLERGWHGEMAYMARPDAVRRRAAPPEALPGCRSIVVVSLRYGGHGPRPDEDPQASVGARDAGAARPLHGIVAGYAAGPDYHGVFEKRLSELARFVEEQDPDARTRPYVDYGPVLERDHAQRAGLGWIGKNTMLIDPALGSYLLLGELLTTLPLPPDAPFRADRCGTCTRCIEACPTDAIRGPRLLDARRCISYLTIELKGPIPEPLRPALGRRVFGCDICQEVCPWNGEVPEMRGSPLGIRPGEPLPTRSMLEWAAEVLELSADAYRELYRGTAFSRPGRDGMLRNLCVGLGNSGESEALPVLRRALEDDSELVHEHARWAIDHITGRSATESAVPRA